MPQKCNMGFHLNVFLYSSVMLLPSNQFAWHTNSSRHFVCYAYTDKQIVVFLKQFIYHYNMILTKHNIDKESKSLTGETSHLYDSGTIYPILIGRCISINHYIKFFINLILHCIFIITGCVSVFLNMCILFSKNKK
jgi:hypothetical protein